MCVGVRGRKRETLPKNLCLRIFLANSEHSDEHVINNKIVSSNEKHTILSLY